MPEEQMVLPAGAILRDSSGDRYRVEALLGKGNLSAVYLVGDQRIPQNMFAMKEIIDPSSRDLKRLLSQCEVLKSLEHRALPDVYHVFENENLKRVYLLMEYIPGKSLETLLQEQPGHRFSLDLTLKMLAPIVDALIYLHQQEPPIVHRDVKPANIIMPLDGGEAVLVDFGTPKEYFADGTSLTLRHGSPGYAALEQYGKGSKTDPSTDVYGLGATVYTLLTGVTPLKAISRVTIRQEDDPLQPVSTLMPTISLSVSDAIQHAMSIYKQDRFATVEAFWQALHADSKELQEPSPPLTVSPQVEASLPVFPSRMEAPVPVFPSQVEVAPPVLASRIEAAPPTLSSQVDIAPPVLASRTEATPPVVLPPAETPLPIVPPPLSKKRRPAASRRPSRVFALLALLLVLLIALVLGGIYLLSVIRSNSQAVLPVAQATATPVQQPTATPTLLPTPTATKEVSFYPPLVVSYAGTIIDLSVAQAASTPLYLRGIQQTQNHIQGSFQGLGLTGSFTGTVTIAGELHFSVKSTSGITMFLFDGMIKTGGDIVGTFSSAGQNGQSTSKYGPWNVGPVNR